MANVKVHVPAEAGDEITISEGDPENNRTFKVTDGAISVPESDLVLVLSHVDGSSLVGARAAKPKE